MLHQLTLLELQLGLLHQRVAHHLRVHLLLQVEVLDQLQVQLDRDVAGRDVIDLGDVRADLSKCRLLDPCADVTRRHLGRLRLPVQLHRDNRRLDCLRRVHQLLNARHTHGDVHASNTSEVESLERHLCRRLADALRDDRANRSPRLHR